MIKHKVPGWSTNYKPLKLAITNVTNETISDFIVFVNLGSQSGANQVDTTWLLDISGNYKNYAFWAEGQMLDAEVEYFDPVNKTAQFWVRLPQINGYSSVDIYVQVDPDKTNDKVNDIGNATAVWNTTIFKAVYHFSQDPSAGTVKDSTANGLDLTPYGGVDSTNLIDCYNEDGKYVGRGLQFNNGVTAEYLKSSNTDLNDLVSAHTVFYLIKWDAASVNWGMVGTMGLSSIGGMECGGQYITTGYYTLSCWGDDVQVSYPLNKTQYKTIFYGKDGTVLRFNFNGSQDFITNDVSCTDHSNVPIVVGTNVGTTYWFEGRLKNFFIAKTCFTQEECRLWTLNLHDKLVTYHK